MCGNPIEDTPHVVPVIYRAKETEFIMCDKCFDKVRKMFTGGQNLRPEMRQHSQQGKYASNKTGD